MIIKNRYRIFLLWCLAMDLALILWMGYRYAERKIPDEIRVERGQALNVEKLARYPLITVGDAIAVSGESGYILPCRLFGLIPFKEIRVSPASGREVFVSGSTIGIYMETEGVLIIDTGEILSENGLMEDPARNIVKPGDYIVAFNEQKISTKKELIQRLSLLQDGGDVVLDVKRNGETVPVSLSPVRDLEGKYKLGIWVRDDTQGIGTLTFVDEAGNFAALGHGISDVDTGELLQIHEGDLYHAEVLGILKGSNGSPGEISGLIRYEARNIIGQIRENSRNGIYGKFDAALGSGISLRRLPVAYKQEMEIGPASILCCIGDEVEEYAARITRIDMNHEDTNKSFVIQVTDERLLSATGGIVQGMSGSPVLQNGRLVGAVTHVFVQDSTSGYGIFIENMLDQGRA